MKQINVPPVEAPTETLRAVARALLPGQTDVKELRSAASHLTQAAAHISTLVLRLFLVLLYPIAVPLVFAVARSALLRRHRLETQELIEMRKIYGPNYTQGDMEFDR